jgi:hypothetical protein
MDRRKSGNTIYPGIRWCHVQVVKHVLSKERILLGKSTYSKKG